MSSPVFYRSALCRSLTPDERRLLESCLARSEQMDAVARSLPELILANRTKREGRKVTFTKTQLRAIRSSERDEKEADAEIPKLVAKFPSVRLLLHTALDCERGAMRLDTALSAGGHPDDEVHAKPLLELRSANIAEIEEFLLSTTSL
jgi:hypothetical protein